MAEKAKTPTPVSPLEEGPARVRAKKMCFYGGMRIRPGKTFTLLHPSTEFNGDAMEYVDAEAVDDTALAVAASPKQRGSAGVQLKRRPDGTPMPSGGTLIPDPGI